MSKHIRKLEESKSELRNTEVISNVLAELMEAIQTLSLTELLFNIQAACFSLPGKYGSEM